MLDVIASKSAYEQMWWFLATKFVVYIFLYDGVKRPRYKKYCIIIFKQYMPRARENYIYES